MTSEFNGQHVFGSFNGHAHCIYCAKWRFDEDLPQRCTGTGKDLRADNWGRPMRSSSDVFIIGHAKSECKALRAYNQSATAEVFEKAIAVYERQIAELVERVPQ